MPRPWSRPKCSSQRISHSGPMTHAPGSLGRHHQRGWTLLVASARQIPTRIGAAYPGSVSVTCAATWLGIEQLVPDRWPVQRPDREHARLTEDQERDPVPGDHHVAFDQPPVRGQRGEPVSDPRLGDREPVAGLHARRPAARASQASSEARGSPALSLGGRPAPQPARGDATTAPDGSSRVGAAASCSPSVIARGTWGRTRLGSLVARLRPRRPPDRAAVAERLGPRRLAAPACDAR